MATSAGGPDQSNGSERPGSVLTWTVTILACAYFAWIAFSLYHSTAAFSNLYVSLNAKLHGASWFVIHHYHWFYPSFFGGAAALLITKQFFVRRKWISLTITLGVTVAVDVISNGIVRELYRPVLDFTEKLNK
jgi:hypothetical protein